jgi:hypothetical protein
MNYELVNTKKVRKLFNFIYCSFIEKTPANIGKKERKLFQLSLTLQDSHNRPWAKLLRSSSMGAMPIKHLVQGR